MEIEKSLVVAAPAAQVWSMLLDPNVMGGCVPGMQAIEVISDVEYVALIQVKVAFISARFRLRTVIVEARAPHYLRCEGTGEDASVASSLRQQSEIFLTALPGDRTELRIKVQVEVLGRLGAFGLSAMKTKADRMWEEFGHNLVQRLSSGRAAGDAARDAAGNATGDAVAPAEPAATAPTVTVAVPPASHGSSAAAPRLEGGAVSPSWFSRLFGRGTPVERSGRRDICIELRRPHETVTVRWPVADGQRCGAWLRDYLASGGGAER